MPKVLIHGIVEEDLPLDDPEVARCLLRLQDLTRQAAQASAELIEWKKSVQRKCGESGHDFVPIDNERRIGADAKGIRVGKICTKCRMFQQRKEGSECKVCIMCEGEMEFKEKIEKEEEGRAIYVYSCASCGHIHKQVRITRVPRRT